MKISVSRVFNFCSAHRLTDYKGKCQYIHGHNYQVRVWCEPKEDLNSLGMVVDYADIKDKIGTWIDENLDHSILVSNEDKEFIQYCIDKEFRYYVFPGNCTAEIMAQDLLIKFNAQMQKHKVKVIKVELWETANCSAEASL